MLPLLMLSFATLALPMSPAPRATPDGVTKATFDKIQLGMTAGEVEKLFGYKGVMGVGQLRWYECEWWYSERWSEPHLRVEVIFEPTIADGKVTSACFTNYSASPPLRLELRRVATEAECGSVIDHLIADASTRMPLGHSVDYEKQIPPDPIKATKFIIDHPNYESYHLLMALFDTNLLAYGSIPASLRASVLCSTLEEQEFFDDWWSPESTSDDPHGGDPQKDLLVDIGMPAVKCLIPLLDNLHWAENSEYEEQPDYDHRVADYAFRYITWILKEPYTFHPEPEDRDRAIAKLKLKIAATSCLKAFRGK